MNPAQAQPAGRLQVSRPEFQANRQPVEVAAERQVRHREYRLPEPALLRP